MEISESDNMLIFIFFFAYIYIIILIRITWNEMAIYGSHIIIVHTSSLSLLYKY